MASLITSHVNATKRAIHINERALQTEVPDEVTVMAGLLHRITTDAANIEEIAKAMQPNLVAALDTDLNFVGVFENS